MTSVKTRRNRGRKILLGKSIETLHSNPPVSRNPRREKHLSIPGGNRETPELVPGLSTSGRTDCQPRDIRQGVP